MTADASNAGFRSDRSFDAFGGIKQDHSPSVIPTGMNGTYPSHQDVPATTKSPASGKPFRHTSRRSVRAQTPRISRTGNITTHSPIPSPSDMLTYSPPIRDPPAPPTPVSARSPPPRPPSPDPPLKPDVGAYALSVQNFCEELSRCDSLDSLSHLSELYTGEMERLEKSHPLPDPAGNGMGVNDPLGSLTGKHGEGVAEKLKMHLGHGSPGVDKLQASQATPNPSPQNSNNRPSPITQRISDRNRHQPLRVSIPRRPSNSQVLNAPPPPRRSSSNANQANSAIQANYANGVESNGALPARLPQMGYNYNPTYTPLTPSHQDDRPPHPLPTSASDLQRFPPRRESREHVTLYRNFEQQLYTVNSQNAPNGTLSHSRSTSGQGSLQLIADSPISSPPGSRSNSQTGSRNNSLSMSRNGSQSSAGYTESNDAPPMPAPPGQSIQSAIAAAFAEAYPSQLECKKPAVQGSYANQVDALTGRPVVRQSSGSQKAQPVEQGYHDALSTIDPGIALMEASNGERRPSTSASTSPTSVISPTTPLSRNTSQSTHLSRQNSVTSLASRMTVTARELDILPVADRMRKSVEHIQRSARKNNDGAGPACRAFFYQKDPTETIYRLLSPYQLPADDVEAEYAHHSRLAQRILGAKPGVYRTMALYPPAMRCYNVMIPRYLNIPLNDLGLDSVGTKIRRMVYLNSSLAYECDYCASHCASLGDALKGPWSLQLSRMTNDERAINNRPIVDPQDSRLTELESDILLLVRAASTVPSTVSPSVQASVEVKLGKKGLLLVAGFVTMMGFLNAFMDGWGCDLEPHFIQWGQDQLRNVGWTPGKHRPKQPGDLARKLGNLKTPSSDQLRGKYAQLIDQSANLPVQRSQKDMFLRRAPSKTRLGRSQSFESLNSAMIGQSFKSPPSPRIPADSAVSVRSGADSCYNPTQIHSEPPSRTHSISSSRYGGKAKSSASEKSDRSDYGPDIEEPEPPMPPVPSFHSQTYRVPDRPPPPPPSEGLGSGSPFVINQESLSPLSPESADRDRRPSEGIMSFPSDSVQAPRPILADRPPAEFFQRQDGGAALARLDPRMPPSASEEMGMHGPKSAGSDAPWSASITSPHTVKSLSPMRSVSPISPMSPGFKKDISKTVPDARPPSRASRSSQKTSKSARSFMRSKRWGSDDEEEELKKIAKSVYKGKKGPLGPFMEIADTLKNLSASKPIEAKWVRGFPTETVDLLRIVRRYFDFVPDYIGALADHPPALYALVMKLWNFLLRDIDQSDPGMLDDVRQEWSRKDKTLLWFVYAAMAKNCLLQAHATILALRSGNDVARLRTALHAGITGDGRTIVPMSEVEKQGTDLPAERLEQLAYFSDEYERLQYQPTKSSTSQRTTSSRQSAPVPSDPRLDAAIAFCASTARTPTAIIPAISKAIVQNAVTPSGPVELVASLGLFHCLHRLSSILCPATTGTFAVSGEDP